MVLLIEGFVLLKSSTIFITEKATRTVARMIVRDAPNVVLNFSSPFQVRKTFYPNISIFLKFFRNYFFIVPSLAILSFIIYD